MESYLNHQGEAFLNRFDALSYLYLTRVMDYFDAFADIDTGSPGDAFTSVRGAGTKFCVLSFDTDWRFDTEHSRRIAHVLDGPAAGHLPQIASVVHDSFPPAIPAYHDTIRAFSSAHPRGPYHHDVLLGPTQRRSRLEADLIPADPAAPRLRSGPPGPSAGAQTARDGGRQTRPDIKAIRRSLDHRPRHRSRSRQFRRQLL